MEQEQYDLMYQLEDRHWWFVGMRRITAAILKDVQPQGRYWRILDAGCGTGGTTLWLQRYGRVVGIDLSELGLHYCRQRGLSSLARGSVESLPFVDNAFDLVTSFDVLYHLDVHSDTSCLHEFRRVLRPGGYLLLRVPAHNWLQGGHDRAVHTRQRYSAGEIRTKLGAVGFKQVKITYANCILFPLAVIKRLAEIIVPIGPDLAKPSSLANLVFGKALNLEAHLLEYKTVLPWGLSVIALAQKP